ncbi:MAG: HlyD family secretion protein [Acidobacteria bacterium]|nr:MAG: HlyD family secretion protein [Acidobacteriota bacterium]PYQ24767.1 MAG: HlyD family secretion protein [Acidobacteriota bacterium]
MRRARWIGLGVIVAAVVAGLVWRHYAGRESTDDAQIDGHIVPVAARVGGTVQTVAVADNQFVDAGTLLVQLDPRDYQVAFDHARADLLEAEASAQAARTTVPVTSTTAASQVSGAESDIGTARARVRSAQAQLQDAQAKERKAEQDLARIKTLHAKDEVSQQEYDAAAVAAESGRAARESAQATVKEAEEGVGSAAARLSEAKTAPQQVGIMRARAASAEAKVVQARATLARAQLELEYATVKAPAAGIVSKKTVEVGQVIQPGQPLLAIVPLDDIWVTANFKESQLREIRPGQRAVVAVDAYGGRSYQGRVDSIAPATGARFSLLPPENATGNYVKVVQRVPVKIVFDKGQDSEHLLRPGMSVVPTVFVK